MKPTFCKNKIATKKYSHCLFQKRATLVGQTSRGGANPRGTVPWNNELSVFIPTGMAINPITKTSWEGVGVIPKVLTQTSGDFG
jgi:hypothetical protein